VNYRIEAKVQTQEGMLRSENRTLVIMVLPCIIVLFLTTVAPLFHLLITSTYDWNLTKPFAKEFYGFGNYLEMFTDDEFYDSVWVALQLIFESVFLQILLGIALAELLAVEFRGKNLLRTLFIFPMVIPPVVAAVLWRIMYNPRAGLFSYFLGLLGIDVAMLGSSQTALHAVVIVEIWQHTPFVLLMFMAAYSVIPEELYEAADIDGAGWWGKFRYITLPAIRPMIMVAVLFRVIGTIKVFPSIFIMTHGGPGTSTTTVNFYTYIKAFEQANVGYSSAVGVFMFVMVIVTILVIRHMAKYLGGSANEQA